MDGVGRVKVMLTAADGGETVYAAEEKSRSQQSGTGSESSYENNYVLVDGGSGRGALIESARQPEIRGAASAAARQSSSAGAASAPRRRITA